MKNTKLHNNLRDPQGSRSVNPVYRIVGTILAFSLMVLCFAATWWSIVYLLRDILNK